MGYPRRIESISRTICLSLHTNFRWITGRNKFLLILRAASQIVML